MPDHPTQNLTPAPPPEDSNPNSSTRVIAQSSIVSNTEVNTASVFGGRDIQRLGHYRIEKELGRGGMGVVYKAHDEQLDRPVAIKVISPEYASLPGCVDRLRIEARAAARIVHQNIISVHAFSEDKGLHYIVMEYVEGMDLAEKLRREGQIPLDKALGYTRDAALALKYAAEHSIIHRDIKPSNLFITRAGHAKVMDFGLAKRLDVDSSLTVTGAIIGTPSYMAPEQGAGAEVDHRADIYSLGCTLFTILSGRKPFEGRTPLEVLMQHSSAPLPIPADWSARFGKDFVAFLVKMAAKNPEERHATWADVIADIDHLLNRTTTRLTLSSSAGMQSVSIKPSSNRFTIPIVIAAVAAAFLGGLYLSGVGRGRRAPQNNVPISHTLAALATPTPLPSPAPTPAPTAAPALATPIQQMYPEDGTPGMVPDPDAREQALRSIAEARELARAARFEESATTLQSVRGVPPVLLTIVGDGFDATLEGLALAHGVKNSLMSRGVTDPAQMDQAVVDIMNSQVDLETVQRGLIFLYARESAQARTGESIYLRRNGNQGHDQNFARVAFAVQTFMSWKPGEPPPGSIFRQRPALRNQRPRFNGPGDRQ